jgi:hypothetical protein
MKTIQTSAIAVAALLVAVATAFALWADALKMHVEVNTGKVDIEFTGTPRATESHDTKPGEFEGKDVGSCTAEFVEVQDEERAVAGLLPTSWNPSSANADNELKIVISNAYPGYQCKISDINVMNVGTVPVKLLVKILDKDHNVIRPEQHYGGYVSYIDTDGDSCTELDVDYSSFFHLNGTQLHPGEYQSFTVNLRLPTERQQCIAEKTTYTFYVVIIGYQWNEFPG